MNESSGGAGPPGVGGGGGARGRGAQNRGRGRGWNRGRGRGRGYWPRKNDSSREVRETANFNYDDNGGRDESLAAFRGNEHSHSQRSSQYQRNYRGGGGQGYYDYNAGRGELDRNFQQFHHGREHFHEMNDVQLSNGREYTDNHRRTLYDNNGRTYNDNNGRTFSDNNHTDKHNNYNKTSKSRTRRKGRGGTGGDGKSEEKDVRTRLTDLCVKGLSECMICLERVKQHQSTWNCLNCYQIFHLGCIRKWARSATVESGWRCPGCQVVVETLPREYRCFCRKLVNPEWNRNEGLVPHSCGEVCGRPLNSTAQCRHTCKDLCHPGPCHPCQASLRKTCPCGSLTRMTRCDTDLLCGKPCGKLLSCGRHSCSELCHLGPCPECEVVVSTECHCGKTSQERLCRADSGEKFSCGEVCGGILDCGNHQCQSVCHPGDCAPCPLTPARVTTCPCGKTPLRGERARTSCTDEIPVCGAVCDKLLTCGPPSAPHRCQAECHLGPCPPCPLTTSVRCRCGFMDQELPCSEMTSRADDARCQRKCQKKRSCGRHKCGELCCIRVEHPCPLLCNKLLSCKQHYCQENCHTGKCRTCQNVSFSELTCHCGASVIYPPVPCGTRPPDCAEICRRDHPCGHPVLHACHSDTNCPPCTTLTNKRCYCGREERRNIPCLVEGVSCGKQCGRPLSCGRHRCIKICHPGECQPGSQCVQPCTVPRPCGHPCLAPCHEGDCPDTVCATKVKLSCDCGRRQTTSPCSETSFSTITTSLLASQMADIKAGNSVDLSDLARKNKKIECNEECFQVARNAQLASALQIDNPELSSKVIPRYSDFMKEWFKRDATFCSGIYSKLVELVKLSKESKQKSRAHSFPVMNRDKRQFVHELAAIFGCESQSYDAEPKRNVVVTALREKSSIPSVSLAESAVKQKKAPTPKPDSDLTLPTFTTLTKSGSEAKIDWFG